MPFRFEGLQIWHQAREFAALVYEVTASFPDTERYGLAGQMMRAANSVSLNIAEGSGRNTDADFTRFLSIAIGSAFEVAGASFLALDRGYIDEETHQKLYAEAQRLAKSIGSFRRTLLRKP